jgi:hypothetical protein
MNWRDWTSGFVAGVALTLIIVIVLGLTMAHG